MSDSLLLDVNVLLALAWPNHQCHLRARARVEAGAAWATCALTQLAFVRLYVTPAVVGIRKPVEEALVLLASLVSDDRHAYWAELPSLDEFGRQGAFGRVMGHRQVNDAYLLELARRRGARLLTFDRRLQALGAPGVAEVLTP